MTDEKIETHDELTMILRDKSGNIKSEDRFDDLIVNKGKEMMAKLLIGVSINPFDYIQIGEGSTAPTLTDIALEDQTNKTLYENGENQATCIYEADYKAKLSATFVFSDSVSITESGVFDGLLSGPPNMLCRQVFSSREAETGDTAEIVWTITMS